MRRRKMSSGDRVWFINDLGRRITGVLVERTQVVAVAEADEELNPGKFKDVDYWTWTIKTGNGLRFVAKEDVIHKIEPN
jgi:hypothetical protein